MSPKKSFLELLKAIGCDSPTKEQEYLYPDHPFIIGYSFSKDDTEWAVNQLNKAFNQKDNFQNPKWAWRGGPLSEDQIILLENFLGQPWENSSNISDIADFFGFDEFIKKRRFLELLKSKLRRRCNIQNPDFLSWEEIFAAINEYMSSLDDMRDKIPKADLKAQAPSATEGKGENKKPRLNYSEKAAIIIEALKKNPGANSTEISQITGIHRTSVSRIRKNIPKGEKRRPLSEKYDTSDPKASCQICNTPKASSFQCDICGQQIEDECRTCHFTNKHPHEATP